MLLPSSFGEEYDFMYIKRQLSFMPKYYISLKNLLIITDMDEDKCWRGKKT